MEGSRIAIFPYFADHKVILVLRLSHATRSWELEIPRGTIQDGETTRSASARELIEKTGYQADDSLLLGTLAVDSEILGSLTPVIACKAKESSEPAPNIVILSVDELEEALIKGFWDVPIGENHSSLSP